MENDSHPPSKTVCKTDSGNAPSQHDAFPTFPSDDVYADGQHHDQHRVLDGNSESVDRTEVVSESDAAVEDGSYAQYHDRVRVQHHEFAHVRHEYHEHHREYHAQRRISPHDRNRRERNYDADGEITELDVNEVGGPSVAVPDRNVENIDVSIGSRPRDSAITTNSFDQVADEIAEDLEVFQQVEEQELNNLAELIPERNQDRLFSEADIQAPNLSSQERIEGQDVHHSRQEAGDEAIPQGEQSLEENVHYDTPAHEGHHKHHADLEQDGNYTSHVHEAHDENAHDTHDDHDGHDHHGHHGHEEYIDQEDENVYEGHHQTVPSEDCGCDEVTEGTLPAVETSALAGRGVDEAAVMDEDGMEDAVETAEEAIESTREQLQQEQLEQDEYMSHHSDLLSRDDESEATLPGPPPSFGYQGERLSQNVADAMAVIWDKFWSEDVREIIRIIKNRFSQIMPYVRRFLAHLAAFWGGITYIRRAIAAFIRLLKRDARVRELLERIGWASATTLRVFLSMCAMIMQASIQFYHLMRDRIIPDTRRVIPILFYKAIMKLIALSYRSPWSIVFGPFSLTFAIDGEKLPDRYLLHDKLGVPRDDVTFTFMHDIMSTVRQSVYRTRYPQAQASQEAEEVHPENMEHHNLYDDTADAYGTVQYHVHGMEQEAEHSHADDISEEMHENAEPSEIASTPVHTQTTDEMPVPPPPGYSGPQYPGSKTRILHARLSNGPLSERTNIEGGGM